MDMTTIDISQVDTITNISPSDHISIWFWVSMAELCIIIIFILRIGRKNNYGNKQKIKQKIMTSPINFSNVINSAFHSKKLYDELVKLCHPDRFSNDSEKNEIANNIFQEITKNKLNYEKLLELKDKAKQLLNINFH
jgi:hypothetical protein